jgi:hypothetical protein
LRIPTLDEDKELTVLLEDAVFGDRFSGELTLLGDMKVLEASVEFTEANWSFLRVAGQIEMQGKNATQG